MILATRLWLTEVIFCCGGVWSSVQLAGDGVVCVLLVGGEIGFLWCEVSYSWHKSKSG